MTSRESLQANLANLLPPDAVQFLLTVWDAIQALDDWVDGDDVPRETKDAAIWQVLVALPAGGFYRDNHAILAPVMASMVLKWKAADTVEREGRELHKAYMWRAGFYDLVLQCVLVTQGVEQAFKVGPVIMELYGETFAEYAGEFDA